MPTKIQSKTPNNRIGGAYNEYRGGPRGPGAGFSGPGGGLLILVEVVACHYIITTNPPPGPQRPVPGPQKPTPGLVIRPPGDDY